MIPCERAKRIMKDFNLRNFASCQKLRSHLAQLFHHLLNAYVSILRDLALHLGEPLTQLLVLLVKHGPFVQLFAHLLPA